VSGRLHSTAAVPLKKLVGPRNQSFLVILLELCIDRRQSIPGPLTVHLRPLFLCGIQCIVDGTGRHSAVFRRVTYHASWRAATNRCRQLRVGLWDTASRQPVLPGAIWRHSAWGLVRHLSLCVRRISEHVNRQKCPPLDYSLICHVLCTPPYCISWSGLPSSPGKLLST